MDDLNGDRLRHTLVSILRVLVTSLDSIIPLSYTKLIGTALQVLVLVLRKPVALVKAFSGKGRASERVYMNVISEKQLLGLYFMRIEMGSTNLTANKGSKCDEDNQRGLHLEKRECLVVNRYRKNVFFL